MLLHVGLIILFARKTEALRADDDVHLAVCRCLALSHGSDKCLGYVLLGVINLPAHAHQMHAVFILVIDREVVVDVTVLRSGARLTPAHPDSARGVALLRPVDDVYVVHMLLDDVIARKPGEVEPVAHLVFEVGPTFLTILLPQPALVPVAARSDDLANVAVMDALHDFPIAGLVAPLRAGGDGEILCLRLLISRQHLADARAVHPDRLLCENAFAGSHGRL